MLAKFIKMSFLFVFFAIAVSGCSHRAPFPELEGHEGTLTSDKTGEKSALSKNAQAEKNKTENDIKASKDTSSKSVTKQAEEQVKKTEKIESSSHQSEKKIDDKAKDLSKPNPEVEDIEPSPVSYDVIGSSTHAVLTDIDLTEMDKEDTQVRVIDPAKKSAETAPSQNVKKKTSAKDAKKTTAPSVYYLADTVYFNNGGATVDSKYWGALRKIVKEAKTHNGKIIVQGFASSRTRNTDMMSHKLANLKVSVKRADNVADILVKYGMPRSKIITEGLSDSRPLYQEVMPEGERLNRRAEIYICY